MRLGGAAAAFSLLPDDNGGGILAEDHGERRNCLFCGLLGKSSGQKVAERRVRNRESSGPVPDSRPRRKPTETDGQGRRAGGPKPPRWTEIRGGKAGHCQTSKSPQPPLEPSFLSTLLSFFSPSSC